MQDRRNPDTRPPLSLLFLFSLLFLLLLCLSSSSFRRRVVMEEEGGGGGGGGIDWREVVGKWNHAFRVPPKASGPVVNPYPSQVTFSLLPLTPCDPIPLILAGVVTSLDHRDQRLLVRGTWGHGSIAQVTGVKVIFVVGQNEDLNLQEEIEAESSLNGDILQANFIDSYRNLTYKTTALLAWAAAHCPRVPLVLKIDDDMMLHPLALRDFLGAFLRYHPRPTRIMGKVRCCDPVLRKGKWAVQREDYPREEYPVFVAGPAYILPSSVIPALLHAMERTKTLYLEDVYTTGLAARTCDLRHHSVLSLTSHNTTTIPLWLMGARVFQEHLGLAEAARAWNQLLKVENLTNPPEYHPPSL